MSMDVYAMNYSNLQQNDTKTTAQKEDKEEMKQTELQQNVGSVRVTRDKYREDGTISMVQRMQGTEVYRRVKDGREGTGELQEEGDARQYPGNIRRDTAIISEEGRQVYSQMSRQKEGYEKQSTLPAETGMNEKQGMLLTEAGMNEK